MKLPKETIQVARKGNGSGKLSRMGDAYAREGMDVPSQDEKIATAAYFRAEKRGFAPGNEMDDWLQAEAELNSAWES